MGVQLDVSHPVLLPRGGGEVVGDSADRRVEILSDAHELNATWSRFGPHREGADLHVHRRHSDLFYVLEGELTLRLGPTDEPRVALPGTLVRVPPLVVHGFRNGSDAELRYLNLHAPGQRFADYLRALRDGRTFVYDQEDPPADGGRSPDEASIGGGELVADRPGLRVDLLADVEEIAIAEVRSEPGQAPPPSHLHRRHVESFYVLAGELAFTVAARELRAEAGTWVQVPAGVAHTFAVAGSGEARFLNLHTPSCGFGDFVRALHAARDESELAAARFDQVPA
jgi:mannose-6-phosphate isomerase-like protein (cupin superfamily)